MGGATPVRASNCASACMLCVATGAKVTVAELLGGLGEGRVRGVANLRKRLATSGHAQHQLRPPPGKPQTEKVRREGGEWAGKEGGREVGTKGKREGGRGAQWWWCPCPLQAQRAVAYSLARQEVSRWLPIVSHNRQAEHLAFPLQEEAPPLPSLASRVEGFQVRGSPWQLAL